jgi:hypothetical protein
LRQISGSVNWEPGKIVIHGHSNKEAIKMKKVELVYDKYGFCIGKKITTTIVRHRKAKKTENRTYTEAEHRAASLRLAEQLEAAYKQAKETGGDICISRNGVDVVPFKPNRKVFY